MDGPELTSKTAHVILFGTPSGGLPKAALVKIWRHQFEDIAEDSKFIRQLRESWKSRFSDGPPFQLLAIAGCEDDLVPASSSLGPFDAKHRAVVPGDHLGIVKPTGRDHPSVRLIVRRIVGDAEPAGPWNSARVAVENGDFQQAIDRLGPHRAELDAESAVSLALALEGVGRAEDAIELIEEIHGKGWVDATGVLAGRLRRRWLATGRAADAERAYELYQEARTHALKDDNPRQVFRLVINIAFLELAHHRDSKAAQLQAKLALHLVRRSGAEDPEALAAQAEAFLYLGEPESALSKYRQVLSAAPTSRDIESIFQHATTVAGYLRDAALIDRLTNIFRGALSSSSTQ